MIINEIPQAVDCKLLLNADVTCLIFQHKEIIVIGVAPNKFLVRFETVL